MKYTFDVAFLPCEALKKHDARIVVDLLRATTQITTFFDMGGEVLVPVTEVDEAFAMKEKLGEDWKIMGERGGLPAPGFDFGNSPLELQAAGAPEHAIITTSNGTRAIMRAVKDCAHVIAGCARNAEAAAWDALCAGPSVGIICAGRRGTSTSGTRTPDVTRSRTQSAPGCSSRSCWRSRPLTAPRRWS